MRTRRNLHEVSAWMSRKCSSLYTSGQMHATVGAKWPETQLRAYSSSCMFTYITKNPFASRTVGISYSCNKFGTCTEAYLVQCWVTSPSSLPTCTINRVRKMRSRVIAKAYLNVHQSPQMACTHTCTHSTLSICMFDCAYVFA